jgi:hypothetical protein
MSCNRSDRSALEAAGSIKVVENKEGTMQLRRAADSMLGCANENANPTSSTARAR